MKKLLIITLFFASITLCHGHTQTPIADALDHLVLHLNELPLFKLASAGAIIVAISELAMRVKRNS